ncbi:hypothetical protein GCM10010954_25570 [Halobacillus andaensis]|uniref:Uncharacterized protein n=1 Tax=Halobacillus andaensis TaxID=1176239 RepID=A0A917B5Q2_HALAA|nr:hypothetical protein [Halobacillus andaensis]MBP2005856.1 hypothetical protein [Halobacillus andaensis]GGF25542.1 hypothetical protein GCM10010954_25570 [Halobacillus andaensis]
MKKLIIAFIGIVFFTLGCSSNEPSNEEEQVQQENETENFWGETASFEGDLSHVHGVGYFNNETIAFASHTGLKLYQDEEWKETEEHRHDYMGFNAVENGFYTSGHPNLQSDYPNPLGLQRSGPDTGELEEVAVEGESDFHIMGAGYQSRALYLWNEEENSQMDLGYYKSLDEGESWTTFQAEGIEGDPFQISVHPTDEQTLAVATGTGVYLSKDGGEQFNQISDNGQGSGMFFNEDELYYGIYKGEQELVKYDLESEEKETIPSPPIKDDAVLYLAVHPDEEEMVVFTAQNNSFITNDSGGSWSQIVEEGTVN